MFSVSFKQTEKQETKQRNNFRQNLKRAAKLSRPTARESRGKQLLLPFSRLAIFRLALWKKGVNGDAFEILRNRREAREINDLLQTTRRSFVAEIAAILVVPSRTITCRFQWYEYMTCQTDRKKITSNVMLNPCSQI